MVADSLVLLAELSAERALDLTRFRAILSYPTWNFLQQAIVASRSYDAGLEAGLRLLRFAEEHQDELGEDKFRHHCCGLIYFVLDMLDRLDRWEDYLETWNSVRTASNLEITYARSARDSHGTRFEPFIVREDEHTLYVHFLWGTLHRKEVIERKLARLRRGKSKQSDLHARNSELSAKEVRRRLEWIEHLASLAQPRE